MDQRRLLEKQNTIQDNSRTVDVKSDPMQHYNFVIECYHFDENRVGSFNLHRMPENCLYSTLWKILSYPCYLLIFELLIIAPGLGLVLYLWMLFGLIHYFRGLSVFHKNTRIVSDPMQNMIFVPEICRRENVTNKFISIEAKELDNFTFPPEIKNELKAKEVRGTIAFMAYDTKFYNYYQDYPKLKNIHILSFLLATCLLGCEMYLGYLIYNGGN